MKITMILISVLIFVIGCERQHSNENYTAMNEPGDQLFISPDLSIDYPMAPENERSPEQPVPEPSTLVLITSGVGILAARRLKKKYGDHYNDKTGI